MEKIKLLCKLEKQAAGRGGLRKNSDFWTENDG